MKAKQKLAIEEMQQILLRLKKLSFGQRIKHKNGAKGVITNKYTLCSCGEQDCQFILERCTPIYDNYLIVGDLRSWYLTEKEMRDWEIIGHPITLEDVLECIHEVKGQISWEILTLDEGHLNIVNNDTFSDKVCNMFGWKCGAPYQEQSEETKNYIANLILG